MAESPAEYFQLEIARLGVNRVEETHELETPEEVDARLDDLATDPEVVIGVTYVFEDGDEGSFWLFLNGDRAYVHLIDGRCYTARDPAYQGPTEGVVTFQDDAGFPHHIPLPRTLACDRGLPALRHWTQGGEKLPALTWELDRTDDALGSHGRAQDGPRGPAAATPGIDTRRRSAAACR